MPDFYYKATVRWNNGSLGKIQNTFSFRHNAVVQDSDTTLLANTMAWITGIIVTSGLRIVAHTSITFSDGSLDQVDATGNVIRHVGGFGDATLSGQSSGESMPRPVAMSGTARTNTPKVRGGKRFFPPVEGAVAEGLLINTAMSYLVAAVSRWLAGYTVLGVPRYVSGVFSERTGGFVPFNGTGLVYNVPGTQVTRKPGRGY